MLGHKHFDYFYILRYGSTFWNIKGLSILFLCTYMNTINIDYLVLNYICIVSHKFLIRCSKIY